MHDVGLKDCYREAIPTGGFTWQRGNIMSRLDMILVSSGKAALCTGTETDWNLVDSDHAGVKLWLDVRNLNKRGPGLFKVNGSLLENPCTS